MEKQIQIQLHNKQKMDLHPKYVGICIVKIQLLNGRVFVSTSYKKIICSFPMRIDNNLKDIELRNRQN